ncbi:MAG: MraY family glycosyltransferase [Nitriliruptorales bacterium]
MSPFLAVFVTAVIVTAVVTPPVARIARWLGAVDVPGEERKVHGRPIPSAGGLALLAGFGAALGTAWLLAELGWDVTPTEPEGVFAPVLDTTSEVGGVVAGAIVIVLVGLADDVRRLSPPVKLAGQILAALLPVLMGIQLVYAWIPGLGVLALSPDLGVPLTVFVIVAMVNAVNFIDGLDGLAAGVVAIAALAFFGFVFGTQSIAEAAPNSATLVAAGLAGTALGFLGHNFHPARIFMGDTGSMLLGLLLACAGVAFVGRTTDPSYLDLAGAFPLAIPVLVLAVAFADTAFAVVRRMYHRQPITMPDRGHLHHRLLRAGIGQTRAVLLLYYWSAVVAFAAVGVIYLPTLTVVFWSAVLVVLGAAATTFVVARARRQSSAVG